MDQYYGGTFYSNSYYGNTMPFTSPEPRVDSTLPGHRIEVQENSRLSVDTLFTIICECGFTITVRRQAEADTQVALHLRANTPAPVRPPNWIP